MIERFMGQYIKYHLDEHESIRELYTLREHMSTSYIKHQKSVNLYFPITLSIVNRKKGKIV